jgi:uncharacterized protein
MAAYTAFPYRIGANGLTASATSDDHLAQLIEQVLFVEPGERVNRPQFGCALRQLVFSGRNTEITAVVGALVQGALRQWLGDLIQLQSVDIDVSDQRISVDIRYADLRTQETRLIRVSN